jgi:hypothetical protein
VLQVRLYHYRDIMSISPVTAEFITSSGENHVMSKKNKPEAVLEGDKQGLDRLTGIAKFPLKFNTGKIRVWLDIHFILFIFFYFRLLRQVIRSLQIGSRGALATLRFSVEVLFMGMSKPIVLQSSVTKPFVVCRLKLSLFFDS